MKKTIYIPRGDSGSYNSLVCENIVVNGSLEVSGAISAKKISGSGMIRANVIKADSLAAHDITAGYIVADEILTKRLSAVLVTATRCMAVSSYLEAGYVRTPKAILAIADVEDMHADEITKLSPKEHSLFGALLLSALKSAWVEMIFALKNMFDDLAEKNRGKYGAKPESSEAETHETVSEEADDYKSDTTLSREYSAFLAMCEMMKNGAAVTPDELSKLRAEQESEPVDPFAAMKRDAA